MTYPPASRHRAGLMMPRHAQLAETTMIWGGTSTGSANAQTITPEFVADLKGRPTYVWVAGYSNTGAMTLSADAGVTATALRKADGTAMAGGEIVAGTAYQVVYDGTYWRLLGGSSSAAGATWCGVAAGTANALALTPTPAFATYLDGTSVSFLTGASENTGAVTVAVSGLAAVPLVTVSGFALSARDLRANTVYQATYYSGSFRLAGTATSSAIPTSGLLSRIDAGDAVCYSTGQTVANLVASPADGNASAAYNWVLGLTTSAGSDDPTFNGSVGGMSAAQYFSADGGDLLTLASANTTWLDSLHKAGAAGTLAFWVYLTGTTVLFGTADQNNRPGVFFRVTTGGSPELNFAVFNATGSATGANTSTTVPATGAWAFVAVSFAEGVSNGSFYYVNGGFAQVGGSNTFTLSYTSPSSSAAFRKAALLDYGAGPVGPAPSGTRLAQAMLWNRALTKAELDAAFAATRSRYGV
jgi:hypothetical protein